MFGWICKGKKSGGFGGKGNQPREGRAEALKADGNDVMFAKQQAIEFKIAQMVSGPAKEAYESGCSFIVIEFSPNGRPLVSAFFLDGDDGLKERGVLVDVFKLASRMVDSAEILAMRRPKRVDFSGTELATAVNFIDHMIDVSNLLRRVMLSTSSTNGIPRQKKGGRSKSSKAAK